MRRRSSLWLKILLVAFLNLALLLGVFLVFARVQFRLDLGSFLLSPARLHMLSVSRLAALEMTNAPREHWGDLLTQYSATYPADFFLFDRDGTELAGKPVQPPPILFQHRWRGPGPPPPPDHLRDFEPRPGPRAEPDPQAFREPRDLPFGMDFARTSNPSYYWAAVRVPIYADRAQHAAWQRPAEGRLIWRFSSLWTNAFFFDYKPWLLTVLLVILVSIVCWLPLIRSLTRTITAITAATGQIAAGGFEIKLPTRRRDELGRLSESINQMALRLSGFVNGQRRFLGDIAHELCSPVARIQFSLGILQQRAGEKELRYVETIDEEVQHMSTLVNELLSFSKASLGQSAALESVNVAAAVQRAIDREKTENVTITAEIAPSLAVLAHPDYLFRSVSNVLRNAIRYAGNDGPIEVSARQLETLTVITIADHGPGVPAVELEEILKPFYRPETARQRETGGVGLGLAIVRTCMESCGGSVVCHNRAPKGFEVELRLRPAAGMIS